MLTLKNKLNNDVIIKFISVWKVVWTQRKLESEHRQVYSNCWSNELISTVDSDHQYVTN